MVLQRFYSSEEERNTRTLSCNFIGHLENEETACVAVTGCLNDDKMEMTINSRHAGSSNMFVLHKNGHVEMVESAFKDSRVKTEALRVFTRGDEGNFHNEGDEMVDDDEVAEIIEIEELCNSGNCDTIPTTNLMKLKIGYDDTFKNSFSSDSEVDPYLNAMVAHVQAHFCLASLGTKIKVERVGALTHHAGQSWKAESDSNSLQGPIKDITAADTTDADLWVYLAKDEQMFGVVGLGWVGTLCKTTWSGYQASISEKRSSVLSTAEVVTHEMGHNMNMLHDFDEEHAGKGCDGTGFMSYGSHPYEWSTCSKNDFLALYNQIVQSSSWSWCMPEDSTACGGDSGTPTPPSPPTPSPPTPTPAPPPPKGCGSPQWAKDDWCDDENNNAECAYDGGACCGNTMPGWDNYCNACACLDPNAPTEPPCKDIWKPKKCNRIKNKGRCNKKKPKKNCKATCGFC